MRCLYSNYLSAGKIMVVSWASYIIVGIENTWDLFNVFFLGLEELSVLFLDAFGDTTVT